MKRSTTLASMLFLELCTGAIAADPSSARESRSVRPLPEPLLRYLMPLRMARPAASILITNNVSQQAILDVTDTVNIALGIDGYVDGYCGFGARLLREYYGRESLVRVDFSSTDPHIGTLISFRGGTRDSADQWRRQMTNALERASLHVKTKTPR